MPDPSLIHGKALPAPELPDGTVTVRVVRESIGNDIPGPAGHGDDRRRRRAPPSPTTAGRAEFTGLPAGQEGRAAATVDGEAMESDPFTVPTTRRPARHPRGRHRQGGRAQGREAARAAAAPAGEGHGGLRRQQPRADAVRRRRAAGLLRARDRQQRPRARGHRRPARHRPAARHERRHAARGHRRRRPPSPATASPSPDRSPPGTTPVQIGYRLAYDSRSPSRWTQPWPAAFQQVTVGVAEDRRADAPRRRSSPTSGTSRRRTARCSCSAAGRALAAGTPLTRHADEPAVPQPHAALRGARRWRPASSCFGVWLAARTGADARRAQPGRPPRAAAAGAARSSSCAGATAR